MSKTVLIIILLITVIGILAKIFGREKCPYCKKRNCVEISTWETGREPAYFKEKVYERVYSNKGGDYVGPGMEYMAKLGSGGKAKEVVEKDVILEGTRIYYTVKYRCSDCGKTHERKCVREEKPKIK